MQFHPNCSGESEYSLPRMKGTGGGSERWQNGRHAAPQVH